MSLHDHSRVLTANGITHGHACAVTEAHSIHTAAKCLSTMLCPSARGACGLPGMAPDWSNTLEQICIACLCAQVAMNEALAAGRGLLLLPVTPYYTYQQALQFKHCWSSSRLVLLHPVDPTENLMSADMLGAQGSSTACAGARGVCAADHHGALHSRRAAEQVHPGPGTPGAGEAQGVGISWGVAWCSVDARAREGVALLYRAQLGMCRVHGTESDAAEHLTVAAA